MTRIAYIAGPPANEYKDRAAEVKPLPFFNPLIMSEGKAYLTLMRDQALTLAQYYPDRPIYRKGLAMIDNTLNKGVHGASTITGPVDPTLYPVANAIQIFKRKRWPAVIANRTSGIGSWRSQSLVAGMPQMRIGAGEIPAPHANFAFWWFSNDKQFMASKGIKTYFVLATQIDAAEHGAPVGPEWSSKITEWKSKYETAKFVVDLYNEKIEKFAHHPLYNFLPKQGNYPAAVVTKNILHSAGVQSCANAGEFSLDNMALWTRNGILRANISGGAGAKSPEATIFELTGLIPTQYSQWLNGTPIPPGSRDRGDAIGIAPAVIALIAAAITAAASVAVAIINAKNQNAFAAVQGWGTQAYAAGESDWQQYQQVLAQQQNQTDNMLPIILGGAAAAYLIAS